MACFKARRFSAKELAERNYDLDLCGFPHEEEEILPPDLIRRYQEKRATLDADIDRIIAKIAEIICISLEENKLRFIQTVSGHFGNRQPRLPKTIRYIGNAA